MKSPDENRSLVDTGFEWDIKLNKLLIAGGLGAAAVGAVVAAPAIVAFGAATTAGSAAGMVVSDRLQRSYQKRRNS